MKVIIYGIGSSATRSVSRLQALLQLTSGYETICRGFDMDTNTRAGLTENQLFLATEDDFRQKLELIVHNSQVTLESKNTYDGLNTIIPLNDPEYLRTVPSTEGQGACKNPSVSGAVGFLNQNAIHQLIDNDTTTAAYSRPANQRSAYVVLSPCGGTSTGLNITVIGRLLEKGFKVNLFLLTPRYFLRQQRDTDGKLRANTVATLLRLTFEKLEGKMRSLKGTPATGRLYPFIVESDWDENTFAEYNLNKRTVDEEAFYSYVSRVIAAFITDDTPQQFNQAADVQPWRSTYINHETEIREKHTFFNLIMLYPRQQVLRRTVTHLLGEIERTNGLSDDSNMLALLQLLPEPITRVAYAIYKKQKLVQGLLERAVQDNRLPGGSLYSLLKYVQLTLNQKESIQLAELEPPVLKPVRPGSGEGTGDLKPKKGTVGQLFGDLFNSRQDEEDDGGEVPSEAAGTLPRTSIPPLPNELENWIEARLLDYELNKTMLTQLGQKLAQEADYTVGDVLDGGTEITTQQVFTGELKNSLQRLTQQSVKGVQYPWPPALREWPNQGELLDYNRIMYIDQRPYQLRILSLIPLVALSYVRGEYLETYERVKKTGNWCYPDRRYQGIPLSPNDKLYQDFAQFESSFLACIPRQTNQLPLVTNDVFKVSLFTFGLIFDRTKMPARQGPKPVDLNKAVDKESKYLRICINGQTIDGTPEKAFYKIAHNSLQALQKYALTEPWFPDEADAVGRPTLTDVLKLAEDTLFGLPRKTVQDALISAHTWIRETFPVPDAVFPDAETQQEIPFRQAVEGQITELIRLYGEKLIQERRKAKTTTIASLPNPDTID